MMYELKAVWHALACRKRSYFVIYVRSEGDLHFVMHYTSGRELGRA
jgi:hypothetical protein